MPEPDATDAARWYDENRADLLGWDEDPPERTPAPSRRRGAMISARFSQEEVATLRAAAEQGGVSLSALVREAALRAVSAGAGQTPAVDVQELRRIIREELAAARAAQSPSRTDSSIIEMRKPA